MAEGGDLSRTLAGGSEYLIEFECTPCAADGPKLEAVHFCQSCKHFLCTTCSKYHQRLMKSHQLVTAQSTKRTSPNLNNVTSAVAAKCLYHPDRDVEMYCGTHDMVYCSLCVALEHRSCSDVTHVDNVDCNINIQDLKQLEANLDRVTEHLQNMKRMKSNRLKLINKKKTSILKEIKAIRKQINDALDILAQRIISKLDEEHEKYKQEISNDLKSLCDLIISCNRSKPNLTHTYDNKQMFIIEKLARAMISNTESFLSKVHLSTSTWLKFEPNDALYEVIMKTDHIGELIKYDFQVLRTVRIDSDTEVCSICGMCQLSDGTIILIDNKNEKIKRLDVQFNVKDSLDLGIAPLGICSVSLNEVAVLLDDTSLQFISIGQSLAFQRCVSINFSATRIGGMAYCNNHIWISGIDSIHIYSFSGSLEKIISLGQKDRKLFPYYGPGQIAAGESKVYITAWEDRVVVCNNNGDVVDELRDQRLDGTYGVCIVEHDKVLVAGSSSRNIRVLGTDGNARGDLFCGKDLLSDPWLLCYDKQKCCLFIGYQNTSLINIFQLKF